MGFGSMLMLLFHSVLNIQKEKKIEILSPSKTSLSSHFKISPFSLSVWSTFLTLPPCPYIPQPIPPHLVAPLMMNAAPVRCVSTAYVWTHARVPTRVRSVLYVARAVIGLNVRALLGSWEIRLWSATQVRQSGPFSCVDRKSRLLSYTICSE